MTIKDCINCECNKSNMCPFYCNGEQTIKEERSEEIACSCKNFYPNASTIRWMGSHGMLNPGNNSLESLIGKYKSNENKLNEDKGLVILRQIREERHKKEIENPYCYEMGYSVTCCSEYIFKGLK